MFSPYYAWSGRRDPENHCAINVALYGESKRWAMTERGRGALRRRADCYELKASGMCWDGQGLDIWIDEMSAPLPRRVKGRVRLDCEAINPRAFSLESAGRHVWRPIAPLSRVTVQMEQPNLSWRGFGYFDCNQGDEPLENAFSRWTWSRARTRGDGRVFYETLRRREGPLALSLAFAQDGTVREAPAPSRARLPTSLWRLPRETRSESTAQIVSSLEDGPFYARARIAHRLDGEDAVSVHEALDLDRVASPVVKAMLPFRMPRALG